MRTACWAACAAGIAVIGALALAVDAPRKQAPAPPPAYPWRAGAASADITPDRPVLMAGYGGRIKPHESVSSPIHVKALVLDDGAGKRAVIITSDLVGLHDAMVRRVAERVMRSTGIDRADLLFNASHTHAAPWPWMMTDLSGDQLDPVALANTAAYQQRLEQRLGEVIESAVAKLQPVKLSHGLGAATFVMNRRQVTAAKGIILGVNPSGYCDRSVPVLKVEADGGRVIAVLFGAACHNTTLRSDNMAIDGDYAGHAQLEIEKAMPGAVALFMAGCGGDTNPWPRGTLEVASRHGSTLATEVRRVLGEKLTPVAGPLRTALRRVELPIAPRPTKEQLQAMANAAGGWSKYLAAMHLRMMEKGEPPSTKFTAPIAAWQFGDDLTLVGLPGEVVGGYVPLLQKELGPLGLWVAGYCNDVFGYVPTRATLEEGGYETRGMYRPEAIGQFAPQVQDVIVNTVKELAKETGRTQE